MKQILRVLPLTAVLLSALLVHGQTVIKPALVPPSIKQVRVKKAQPDFKIIGLASDARITVFFRSATAGKGVLNVYASDGRLQGRMQVVVNKGPNTWEYYFPARTSGVFIVQFTMGKNLTRTGRVAKFIGQAKN